MLASSPNTIYPHYHDTLTHPRPIHPMNAVILPCLIHCSAPPNSILSRICYHMCVWTDASPTAFCTCISYTTYFALSRFLGTLSGTIDITVAWVVCARCIDLDQFSGPYSTVSAYLRRPREATSENESWNVNRGRRLCAHANNTSSWCL